MAYHGLIQILPEYSDLPMKMATVVPGMSQMSPGPRPDEHQKDLICRDGVKASRWHFFHVFLKEITIYIYNL